MPVIVELSGLVLVICADRWPTNLDAHGVLLPVVKMADLDWAEEADEQAKSLLQKVDQLGLKDSGKQSHSSAAATEPQKEDTPEEPVSKAEASLLTKILRSKLVDTGKTDIEVQRADPKSPLFSVKSFEDLRL